MHSLLTSNTIPINPLTTTGNFKHSQITQSLDIKKMTATKTKKKQKRRAQAAVV